MTKPPDDPVLRDALLARTPGDGSVPCLDADTLAAWFEGTLAAADRRAAEAHAADCVRCQMLLAAMARTAPPVTARPWWRASAVKWIVPLTAAAASAIVWVNLADRTTPQTVQSRVESNPPFQEKAVAAPTPPATKDGTTERQMQAGNEAKLSAKADPLDRLEPGSRRKAEQDMRQQAATLPAVPPPHIDSLQDRSIPGATPIPATPPTESRRADASERFTARPAADAAAGAPPQAAPASPAAGRGGREQPALGGVAETVTVSREASARARSGQVAIQSGSDPRSQWRTAGPGAVERSTDGGASWTTQPTGVKVLLNAGSSPSADVCWVVGAAGTVLRTTDGRSWQRVPFPNRADLVAVSATDDRSAVVTTSDGRQFTTTDGGKNWNPRQ